MIASIKANEADLSLLRIKLKYEKPNPYLYNFTGSLQINSESEEIPIDN